ncbi:phytoene/squalene synthase family protein [Planosporangium flavigriseum]|uniref:Phytoene synthase n=1 Tax=Planosporangium flavigriseum TaxID=373681 RepID=A0A8J3LHP0_9ACTN|nr:phytoene/squalene synthase family protein [Planosporangium flavigriseum]NJC64630.1 phytoene/squalene synthase family protein [Planosporangium flavigriseum]GIG71887.1 phytoene synthase [Planosporangium flavigriseum]
MEPLAASYERCRQLHRRHGRTYYLATRLLPEWKRRHVHALYGFTRYADEIVDRAGALPIAERERQLAAWSEAFLAGLAGAEIDDPLLPAVLHTISVFGLDRDDFRTFLASMAMDLTVTGYATYDDLLEYMEGSAAVIGTMMLPILQAPDPAAAREPARQLGLAFQLTNFIRDVAEDLDLGRVYLPAADLTRFGVTPADLAAARAAGRLDTLGATGEAIRELIAYEVTRAREHYVRAAPGVTMLVPSSQGCVRAAYHLYGGILCEVEKLGYDVFARRARVPRRRRLFGALASILTPAGVPVTEGTIGVEPVNWLA